MSFERRGESFQDLQLIKQFAESQGFHYYPVERETTEALVTDPLLHRIRSVVKKRGFSKVTRKVAITFSGYGEDPRGICEIPEIREYWKQLDQQLLELPALLTRWPRYQYNGPGMHLLLLGEVASVSHTEEGRDLIYLLNADEVIANAQRRIHQAGRKYHLPQQASTLLAEYFRTDALDSHIQQ